MYIDKREELKLVQMKSIVQLAKEEKFNRNEVKSINTEINILAKQARELDEKSRKFKFIS